MLSVWKEKKSWVDTDTSHSSWNLRFIFGPSLTKLHLFPKPVTFINFAVSGLTSIRHLPVPLLPLPYTPNLITIILFTINYQNLNYSVSSIFRTLLLVLSLKLLSHVISLPSYALSTGSESLNASNTSSLTYKIPYLHNVISVQRPRSTRSSSVVTLARPPPSSSLQNNLLLLSSL